MASLKNLVKALLPSGERPRAIRRGPAAGLIQMLDLRKDTQVWLGRYEREVMDWSVRHTPIGGVCVDVGAASGLFSLLLARKVGSTGRVVAFEPNATALRAAIELNCHLPLAPIDVHEGCAGNGVAGDASVDQILAKLGIAKVAFLKIDVDGAEVAVLEGLTHTITRDHPPIALELHSEALRDACITFLRSHGYQTDVRAPAPHEHRPLAYNSHLFAEHSSPRS